MNLNKILKLRKQLDAHKYKCKKDCFECCTYVPFLEEEKALMMKELLKNGYTDTPKGKGEGYCDFLTIEGKCSVYSQRPIICRAFGDLKIKLKNARTEVYTRTCTYATPKIISATPEFNQYGNAVLKRGLIIESPEKIMESIKINNPIIQDA